mmetsp:Transcript_21723/g.10152  ORF Transcript_21723/g.10152 Transcript_21723/m.10152 type:complete len:473 (-) Transcript_21723:730-2148(-)
MEKVYSVSSELTMLLFNKTFKKLKSISGSKYCTRNKEDLACYGYDASARFFLPDAVIFPKNADEVSSILRLANEKNFSVIPRGAGTGMTGGSLPVQGGVIVVMSRFNRIINIDTDNLTAQVEPGVVTGRFHKAVEGKNFFYPPDPSSSEFSTLGGNIAECAGGPRAVKYGVTRDYVLGLEVVLPTGEIIKTGVQTVKGVVGYDLTRLFTGSEGTLGIVTCITLKLLPLPMAQKTMKVVFDNVVTAGETVSEIIRCGIIPRKVEYMDNAAIRSVENFLNIGLEVDADAIILIEVDGTYNEIDTAIERIKKICMNKGAQKTEIAKTEIEAEALWKARNSISPALYNYGSLKINEDIVVPRSKISDMVRKIESLKEETGLTIISFGHAGDGNIHINIMLDKDNKNEIIKAQKSVEKLFDYTIEFGGTISGEHGIGITKSAYMEKEIGLVEMELMRKIKNVFDPRGILNPGKIFKI